MPGVVGISFLVGVPGDQWSVSLGWFQGEHVEQRRLKVAGCICINKTRQVLQSEFLLNCNRFQHSETSISTHQNGSDHSKRLLGFRN